jgi:hypothetical protein
VVRPAARQDQPEAFAAFQLLRSRVVLDARIARPRSRSSNQKIRSEMDIKYVLAGTVHIPIRRRLVPVLFSILITSVCLFGSAGRLD